MSGTRSDWLDMVMSQDGPQGWAARLVGVAIARHTRRDGTGARVSERTLEAATDMHRDVIRRGLRQLIADGWIVRQVIGRGSYGKPLHGYTLTIPDNGPSRGPLSETDNGPPHGPLPRQEQADDGPRNGPDDGPRDGPLNGPRHGPEPRVQSPEARERGAQGAPDSLSVAALTPDLDHVARSIAPACDPATEWQRFHDWHRAKGKQLADLAAAWRLWLGKYDPTKDARHGAGTKTRNRLPTDAEIAEARRQAVEANRRTLAALGAEPAVNAGNVARLRAAAADTLKPAR